MVCQPMPTSEPSRIFISYARKDSAVPDRRLQTDLKKEGFDVWLDTQNTWPFIAINATMLTIVTEGGIGEKCSFNGF